MTTEQSYPSRELILRIAQGDEAAFTALVTPLFERLYGFALRVTKSHEVAEEVVQDVFIRIWQHRKELESIANPYAWIQTILRNLSFDAFRRQLADKRQLQHLNNYFSFQTGTTGDTLLYKDSRALVQQAAAMLPAQQGRVFVMSRFDGLSLDEIAISLGLSRETVKKHLTQALKNVRQYLQAHDSDFLLVLMALLLAEGYCH